MRWLSSHFIPLAILLLSIEMADAAPFAYVNNTNLSKVSVMDLAADSVVATVPVGQYPQGVAVNAAATRVYIGNRGDRTVSVLDAATNSIVETIPVANSPVGLAVNRIGTRVYVCGFPDKVHVVDTTTNTVVANIGGFGSCNNIAVNPAGTRAYVTDLSVSEKKVWVIDTASNSIVATIPVGWYPEGIALNPAGTRAYVANAGNMAPAPYFAPPTVSVIDTATNVVIATVTGFDGTPSGVAVHPDGVRVYVSRQNWSTSLVIDAATNTVTGTLPASGSAIALNPSGTRIYVVDGSLGVVSVIDARTNDILATIPVGQGAMAIGQFIAPSTFAEVPSNEIPTLAQCSVAVLSLMLASLAAFAVRGSRG